MPSARSAAVSSPMRYPPSWSAASTARCAHRSPITSPSSPSVHVTTCTCAPCADVVRDRRARRQGLVVGMRVHEQQPRGLHLQQLCPLAGTDIDSPRVRRTVEFGCAIIIVGLLAGAAGAATTLLLHAIEHLTYHYTFGTLLTGVGDSSPVRRAVGPMIGGALAGFGWWMLRRRAPFRRWPRRSPSHRPIPRLSMSIDAGLQVLLVGSGASLGREGAPRQLAAALGDLGTARLALTARDREILLACAAGAGLGAVYSVPLGGALFAAANSARHLASPRGGHGIDNVQPRGRGRLARHPLGARIDVAGREVVLSVRVPGAGHRTAGRRDRSGVQPRDVHRPTESPIQLLDPGSRDRGRRAADRHLLDLVSGTAGQRQKHPDGEPQQRADTGRCGRDRAVETASDSAVSARGRGRRPAHARASPQARRRDRLSHLPSTIWPVRTSTCQRWR